MVELPKPGQLIRLTPSLEPYKVYEVEQLGQLTKLGLISLATKQAIDIVLSLDELRQRVQLLPSIAEAFRNGDVLPREPFLLFVEALRMRLAYTFDPHYAVSVTQVDLLPHQVDAVYGHILRQPRVRFLLADDPGLGKTIMAGLTLKELKARALVQRCLIVVPAHLQDQWKRELREWFREDFLVFDSGLLRSMLGNDFFQRNQQIIVSLDFAKNSPAKELLASEKWDLLIIDEAHKLSASKYGNRVEKTLRYQLAEELAPKVTHVLFLTATPHKGDDFAYFALLSLLEPRLFADPAHLRATARPNGLPFVLRRSKEQVTDLNGRRLFPPRTTSTVAVPITEGERHLYEQVTAYVRKWYQRVEGRTDRHSRNVALALTVLQRRLSSSLAAITESLRRRRQKLLGLLQEWERYVEVEEGWLAPSDDEGLRAMADYTAAEWESFQERLEGLTAARTPDELRQELRELETLVNTATSLQGQGEESKLDNLRQTVEKHLRNDRSEKLLIFTEFKDTLRHLEARLRSWGLSVGVIHGEMNLQLRIQQERLFRDPMGYQVLIGTDAAGEGVNLQFCRLMVNYDLPWNPNRLEQRMGRIHRYGQTRHCYIWNLVYAETLEGRVLQRLLDKLELMRERLGDSIYDVIGDLMEGVRLEQLIMEAVLKGDSTELDLIVDVDLERRLEDYRRTLQENALASSHIDLASIARDQAESRRMKVVPWDVQYFTDLATRHLGGTLRPDTKKDGVFRLGIPPAVQPQFKSAGYVAGMRITFDREIARTGEAEYFAPGHPVLEKLCDQFLANAERPRRAILVDPDGRTGSLWLFRAQIRDGTDTPVLERLLALFYDRTESKIRPVDPRWMRDLEEGPQDGPPPAGSSDPLEHELAVAREAVTAELDRLRQEAESRRQREAEIKKRWLTDSYQALIAESDAKLFEYRRRQERGEDMWLAIQQEESHYQSLVKEFTERLRALELETQLVLVQPEFEAVALVLPPAAVEGREGDDQIRVRVERAAMEFVLAWERAQGREPEDVSDQKLGYDVVSRGPQSQRFIEVKGFATTGPLELTPHEWQMAQRLGNDYWVYAVENALTRPRLHTIADPASRLPAPKEVLGVVKLVIQDWPRLGA